MSTLVSCDEGTVEESGGFCFSVLGHRPFDTLEIYIFFPV